MVQSRPEPSDQDVLESSSVAVVGAGVVGLTTALELLRAGASVTVYSAPGSLTAASWAAPALFTPYAGPDEARFRRWTEHSWAALSALAREPKSGVTIGELREYFYAPPEQRPWLSTLLQAVEIRPHAAPFVDAVATMRPHIDMLRYMPWLLERARQGGVRFIERRVAAFGELFALGHRVVVNCAGMGARSLAEDPQVKPMHGQVLHVANDIALRHSLHDDAPAGVITYVFVFPDRLVLGGTFDSGRDDRMTDRPTLEALLTRCRELLRLDGHPQWRQLGVTEIRSLAGVRPTRGPANQYEHTRVEREPCGDGRVVVHNYGHGRSGVTLSWATALEAARLALEVVDGSQSNVHLN